MDKLNHLNYANDKGEIYCKAKHSVVCCSDNFMEGNCRSCTMLSGSLQGNGVECLWEDNDESYATSTANPKEEVKRVNRLQIMKACMEKEKTATYDKDKWIYTFSHNHAYRYALGTKGKRTLLCFGVNPSTASPDETDPTIKNVLKFAEKHGFDSYIMLNLSPERATKPNDMSAEKSLQAEADNFETIRGVFQHLAQQQDEITIWAAWGTLITKRVYLKESLCEIARQSKNYNSKWVKMGKLSKDGHPHHPLYLANELEFDEFLIGDYLD